MYRFFCVKCQRVVRVRRLPREIDHHEIVQHRTGICRNHPESPDYNISMRMASKPKVVRAPKSVPTPPTPKKKQR